MMHTRAYTQCKYAQTHTQLRITYMDADTDIQTWTNIDIGTHTLYSTIPAYIGQYSPGWKAPCYVFKSVVGAEDPNPSGTV